jgi:hypothetical protein
MPGTKGRSACSRWRESLPVVGWLVDRPALMTVRRLTESVLQYVPFLLERLKTKDSSPRATSEAR